MSGSTPLPFSLSTTFCYICTVLTINDQGVFMRSITSQVANLKAKTEKIIHLQESLRKENGALRKQNTMLQQQVNTLETEKKELEEKYKVLKLARSLAGDGEKNLAVKLKINELVREIDKCIAQLNK
jgi:uncharacterized protein YlxW (UPF0749 family)